MGEDALYNPPAFQFYASDFINDTADFTAEEVGVYMRLLCHQWKQGSIPRDAARQALIGHVSTVRMRSIWKVLGPKYDAHPIDATLLMQPRLEEVRADAYRVHLRRVTAGSKGGRPRDERSIETAAESIENLSNALADINPGLTPAGSPGGSKTKANEKLNESSSISNTSSSTSGSDDPPVEASNAPRRSGGPRPKADPDTSWVQPLIDSAKALATKQLQHLSVDERDVIARYHCYEFGNCTKTEARNKAQATKVAAALASMSRANGYRDMTVREYVNYARRVHKQREKTPWFDPWLIRAVVEFEAA